MRQILIVGAKGVGKTTILNKLNCQRLRFTSDWDDETVKPVNAYTLFDRETMICDLKEPFRVEKCNGMSAVLFVMDMTNPLSVARCRFYFDCMHRNNVQIPIGIIFNKLDKPVNPRAELLKNSFPALPFIEMSATEDDPERINFQVYDLIQRLLC